MKTEVIRRNGADIALARGEGIIITDVGSALDFIATVKYETGCDRIILSKSAIAEEFFDLSTRIAGEILQKFVNYHVALAITGDFSDASKSLRDFIYESNNGRHLFFAATEEEAAERLSGVQ